MSLKTANLATLSQSRQSSFFLSSSQSPAHLGHAEGEERKEGRKERQQICPSSLLYYVHSWERKMKKKSWPSERSSPSIPTTNGGMQKRKLSRNTYTLRTRFFARLAPICVLRRCLLAKFLHRSSGGSLLRVRCWLGRVHLKENWRPKQLVNLKNAIIRKLKKTKLILTPFFHDFCLLTSLPKHFLCV